jgi:hypothetical protein
MDINFKVKVNTKSNYKNTNGQWLEVSELSGTRVTCWVEDSTIEFGHIKVDFHISEIVEFDNHFISPKKVLQIISAINK